MFGFLDSIFIRISLGGASFFPVATQVADPLKIATNAEEDGQVTVHQSGKKDFLGIFEFDELYWFLKRQVFIWSAIIVLFLLVTMLFISRSDKLADRKADVLHKLSIVFIASSAIFLLTAFVNVLDAIF
jgi:uncharacterized membrane protein